MIAKFSSFLVLAAPEKLWLPVTTTGLVNGSTTITFVCTCEHEEDDDVVAVRGREQSDRHAGLSFLKPRGFYNAPRARPRAVTGRGRHFRCADLAHLLGSRAPIAPPARCLAVSQLRKRAPNPGRVCDPKRLGAPRMRLLGFAFLVVLVLIGVGYVRGWFSVSTSHAAGKSDVTVGVDGNRIDADARTAANKLGELSAKAAEVVKSLGRKVSADETELEGSVASTDQNARDLT